MYLYFLLKEMWIFQPAVLVYQRAVPREGYSPNSELSGPARFGQAKTFQSPEARSMRRRLRKGALKGKAEAEAGCPSVMEISSAGCPKWTQGICMGFQWISHKRFFFDYRDSFVGINKLKILGWGIVSQLTLKMNERLKQYCNHHYECCFHCL